MDAAVFARLFLVCACMLGALPLGALEIRLLPQAAVSGEAARLADIAKLTAGANEGEIAARLAHIAVHTFAGDEREHRLSYEAIMRMIRAEYTGPLVLVGNGVLITRPMRVITRREMQDAVAAYCKQNFPRAVFEFDARILPETQSYFGADVTLCAVSAEKDPAGDLCTVWLIVSGGGREFARIAVEGRVRIPGKALVAARDLERGRTLRAGDTRWQDTADSGREKSLSFEELAGRRLLEDVAEGARLESEQFEKPILVKRGSRVTVIWQREGVYMEAEAIAIEDGREGERVRLKNAQSGREFSARVGSAGKAWADG
jgi:flagella basal body P-ring formation protein FlgA